MRNIIALLICLLTGSPVEAWWWFTKNPPLIIEQKPEPIVPKFRIMLFPADGHNPRETEGISERTIAYQFAEALKEKVAESFPQVDIIIPFKKTEMGDYLRAASKANRLTVDFYLNINFYPQKEKLNKVYLYYVLYNPATDFWQTREESFSFIPYFKAYKVNLKKTHEVGQKIESVLKKLEREHQFSMQQLYGVPYKPLLGLQVPAMGIEFGLRKPEDYKKFIQPIMIALDEIINYNELEKKPHESSVKTPALLTDFN